MTDLTPIYQFLRCETPDSWIDMALQNLELLLLNHANCEKKAASTALSLMYRYDQDATLLYKMSRLAREELRHFERVLALLVARGIPLRPLEQGRYAKVLHQHIRTHEPAKQLDTLIVGAIIEARSCERFAKLAPHLDPILQQFYTQLLASEARHFEEYLLFATKLNPKETEQRIVDLTALEADLILSKDEKFYFHSGL